MTDRDDGMAITGKFGGIYKLGLHPPEIVGKIVGNTITPAAQSGKDFSVNVTFRQTSPNAMFGIIDDDPQTGKVAIRVGFVNIADTPMGECFIVPLSHPYTRYETPMGEYITFIEDGQEYWAVENGAFDYNRLLYRRVEKPDLPETEICAGDLDDYTPIDAREIYGFTFGSAFELQKAFDKLDRTVSE